jgi:hypothetical protein
MANIVNTIESRHVLRKVWSSLFLEKRDDIWTHTTWILVTALVDLRAHSGRGRDENGDGGASIKLG